MKKIAVLGASYLQRPLIEKAKNLGIETHCFAWKEGAISKDIADFYYPISVLDYDQILKKCQEIQIDGITTIAMDICIPVINSIAKELNLARNSEFCSRATTDKTFMKKVLKEASITTADHFESEKKLFDDNNNLQFPLIVKPIDRSGSLGVTIAYNYDELNNAVSEACEVSFQKKCIIESFIQGREVSVESISQNGKHAILGITDKKITDKPFFVEVEHHQPAQVDKELLEKIKNTAYNVLNAVNIGNGAAHTELIIDAFDNIYVIEIGSRMGGDFIGSDLVYLSSGFDYLKAVIDVALNLPINFEDFTVSQNKYSGIYFVSLENRKLLKYFSKEFDFIVKKELLNDNLKNLTSSADRSGYIIYQSDKPVLL